MKIACRYIVFANILTILLYGCTTLTASTMRVTGDGVIAAPASSLVWQQIRSPQFSSAEEASKYVADLTLGGYSDWRLPTSEELLDFYFDFDFGGAKAKELGIRIEGNYWFIDKDGTLKTGAWKDDGDICEIDRGYQKSESGYVRAVRP